MVNAFFFCKFYGQSGYIVIINLKCSMDFNIWMHNCWTSYTTVEKQIAALKDLFFAMLMKQIK